MACVCAYVRMHMRLHMRVHGWVDANVLLCALHCTCVCVHVRHNHGRNCTLTCQCANAPVRARKNAEHTTHTTQVLLSCVVN